MSARPDTTVTLRALSGAPLADDAVRRVVIATAEAIAERTGVPLLACDAADDALTVRLEASRLAAIGFAAELRRLTDAWSERKRGERIWGEPGTGDDDGPWLRPEDLGPWGEVERDS